MTERYIDWAKARHVVHPPQCSQDLDDFSIPPENWPAGHSTCSAYHLLPFPRNMEEDWYAEVNEVIKFDAVANPGAEWHDCGMSGH